MKTVTLEFIGTQTGFPTYPHSRNLYNVVETSEPSAFLPVGTTVMFETCVKLGFYPRILSTSIDGMLRKDGK